jgi:hypothetical protein
MQITRALKNKSKTLAAGGRPVMQNFKTEPTDMEHFSGDKTGLMSRGRRLFKPIRGRPPSAAASPPRSFAGQP